jgi:hypothetical protein
VALKYFVRHTACGLSRTMQSAKETFQSVLSQLQAQVAALEVWTSRIRLFGPEKPKVVVVGAGPAGLNAARGLNGCADVTIIDGSVLDSYHPQLVIVDRF